MVSNLINATQGKHYSPTFADAAPADVVDDVELNLIMLLVDSRTDLKISFNNFINFNFSGGCGVS